MIFIRDTLITIIFWGVVWAFAYMFVYFCGLIDLSTIFIFLFYGVVMNLIFGRLFCRVLDWGRKR
jgi:hypothetical protein